MISNDAPDVEDVFFNPFYAVILAPYLFENQELIATKEDWVLLNAQLIEDIGAETWLKELLDILSLPRVEYDGHDIINPALTVKISDKLQGDHETVVTPGEWVEANVKLISELSPAKWLLKLLDTLEEPYFKSLK
jgi:hypothetical protein